MRAWTSPSSAAGPTGWPPPSSAHGPVCRCRCSRPSRRWAAARAPSPTPSSPGVAHDICSAVHPLALASPFFAEFDLPARGVTLAVPEVSYANPLPGRPAAIGYHDLDRTCAELDDGASWRRLLGPLVERDDGVLGLLLGDKRSLPPDPSPRCAGGSAAAGAGHARVAAASRRRRPRAVHRRCRTHDFARCRRWSPPARG